MMTWIFLNCYREHFTMSNFNFVCFFLVVIFFDFILHLFLLILLLFITDSNDCFVAMIRAFEYFFMG